MPFTKHQVFDWNTMDKYTELKNFQMDITSIFLTKQYELNHTQNVQIIKKKLAMQEGLQFI